MITFFRGFSIIFLIKNVRTHIFVILTIHKPLWSHVKCLNDFGPDRFSRFDVYWIQTDSQEYCTVNASKEIMDFQ